MELVEIKNLSYWYPERQEPALTGINLELRPGEFVLLLGASGSGKSTLCRVLNGLVPHFHGGRISGSARVAGVDVLAAEVRDLALHVGMVFQDPENQLITDSPVSEIAFGLENLGIDPVLMRKRVAEVTATLRLGSLKDKKLATLSGGQKQKVALASVLVMHPEVLVLDEPTSQLDPVSAEDFLATVRSLNDDLGLAVLLAEHRVERCLHFADRVLVMDGGRLAFSGEPAMLKDWAQDKSWVPLPPLTRLFLGVGYLDAPLTVKQGRELLRSIAPVRPEGKRQASARRPRGENEKTRLSRRKTPAGGEPILQVEGLWHIYPDGTEALKGVDFLVRKGESVAIIGENGSGKTSLVKHFNGLLSPTRGDVLLCGESIAGREVAELAGICGMLGQEPAHHLVCDTVRGELEATLEALGVPPAERTGLLERTLEALELTGLSGENPRDLSCGQRTRVALASVLVGEPPLLVLDEPTRGVDYETKNRLARYLADYRCLGGTLILVTHDMEFAAECCGRVLMLGDGRVLADSGAPAVLGESLFFTTQFNKSFRGFVESVITREDARRALEALM